ncbi:glutathione-dependent formaldehyde-activating protein [Sulfitobacter alexandrii]|uniref:Glutathione-dependent formaldehyde-activating protein n=1 Tax=Sulfitobacter alexandrii TaxID=1917485 RepID=A0A1J0WCI5_9RHOB|nr:GFA family protein [Sulfitobacter alexandrii]APE42027.1 glutathione-dependent formaldehyde-activating protein [Sulfitobacter alexandrii]
MPEISGQCLCGAVQVTAQTENPILRACHCDMCRRHTSGAFFSIETVPGSIVVSGDATTYRSSEWAQRGFCGICGSTLWYETLEDGRRNLAAGLFPDGGGAPLQMEFFADMCPQGYRLAGDHTRLGTRETIAMFTGGDD